MEFFPSLALVSKNRGVKVTLPTYSSPPPPSPCSQHMFTAILPLLGPPFLHMYSLILVTAGISLSQRIDEGKGT